jgi:hypothetical protein
LVVAFVSVVEQSPMERSGTGDCSTAPPNLSMMIAPPPAVHADDNIFPLQHLRESGTGELRTLGAVNASSPTLALNSGL